MRERDKPRPLTTRHEKWEHFWYYYKIHTFVTMFSIFFIIMTVRDCSQNIDADVSWGYMGPALTDEQREALVLEFTPIIQDANQDGKKHINFYSLSDQRQIVVMMAAGDTQIFSFDPDKFSSFAKGGAFGPLDELIRTDEIDFEAFPELRVSTEESSEEHVYGLPLENNAFLEHLGIRWTGTYLALRIPRSDKPREQIANENAAAIAQHLFKLR